MIRFSLLSTLFLAACLLLLAGPADSGPRFAIGALLLVVSALGLFVSFATLFKNSIK